MSAALTFDEAAREIVEVLASEADRHDAEGGWSVVTLARMAECAQRLMQKEGAR